ncbi:MAG: peptide ABC transporter substrate-binding protein [Thermoleophilia bacterium]|nr:peptide ABC transporter substrate-binding protein [Thermoleophilia bacterium]MDH4341051.1 peptide ABC transporter substrate-binding protein [Thermoleophilia bacterium]
MRKRSMLVVAGAVALVASLIVGPAATAKSERQAAGTVVIGHDQEPVTLNNLITEGNAYTTSLVTNVVLAGGSIYNQNAKLVPYLFNGPAKLVKSNPLTVSFAYKANAAWSDGRQVTGADFLATYRTIMNPNWDITSREGWEDIASVKVKGKNVTVTFKKGKSYAAWDALVASSPYPAHKMAGKNFNDLYRESLDVSSGPFKFSSWQKGTQLVLVKNTAFKAGKPAKVDRVVFRYIPSTPSLFQALQSGEIQVTEPQPQLQIVDIRKNSKFNVQSGPGYFYEHMDIQFGPKGHPALKQRYVRQALITGINRAQIRQALYVTPGLVASAKSLPVLQSLIFKPFEEPYQPNWAKFGFNQQKAINILKGKGCTGGPAKPTANNSDIWSCPGVGKLSFRFTTTSGNQLRALTFEVAQKQLKSVGIELVPRFGPAGTVFGQVLPSGDWDIFMFTWLGGPTSSATSFGLYGCGGDQNYMNYCNKKASDMYKTAQFTPDPVKRAQILNQAEKIMVNDVPSVPMYVRPGFLINSTGVKGPVLNPTQQGSTWNAELWSTSN